MQTRQPDRIKRIGRGLAIGLLAYGALGVALPLRWPALLTAALPGLVGNLPFYKKPEDGPGLAGLAPLVAHYTERPWLPWAAWLLGLAVLAGLAHRSAPAPPPDPQPVATAPSTQRRLVVGRCTVGLALLVGALLALGAYARLNVLLPQTRGLTQDPYDDEGVYAGAGQLLLQGILPYRDFFFAHPPLAALVYTPALAYHFTAWGSPTSFMIARYLSVAYSLGALLALFALGWQVGAAGTRAGPAHWRPWLFGATAAATWAIDGRAIEINRKIMLDQPMILAALAALGVYLAFLRRLAAGQGSAAGRRGLLVAAGALAALSAFTKFQGLACLVALGLDLTWRLRRRPAPGATGLADLVALGAGFAGVGLAVVLPALLLVSDRFIRMVGFFQVLRPSDGLDAPPTRIADLTATLRNGPTIYLGALGFAALTWWTATTLQPAAGPATAERRALGLWMPIILWSFLSVLLFTYSRSFYNHYYVQLAPPLCLLAGASWLPVLRPWPAARGRRVAVGLAGGLLLPALALAGPAWTGFTTHVDRPAFATAARFITDAVPPEAPVLATDEQFAFLAARPPSHTATGYLVDSYGHAIFLNLGLGTRSWRDLVGAVLRGEHSDNAYAILQEAPAQTDFLDRAAAAALVIVHERGFSRLSPTTVDVLRARSTVLEDQGIRYLILKPRGAH